MNKASCLARVALMGVTLTVALAGRGEARRHVLFIGLDGLSSSSLRMGGDMPTLRKLMSEGSSSLSARTVIPSGSAANWASMFMCAPPSLHGYVNNETNVSVKSVSVGANGRFPDVFRGLRDANPAAVIGFVYQWSMLHVYADMKACDFVHRTHCVDGKVLEFIAKRKPDLLSVVFNQPDDTGHGIGWDTPQYLAKLPGIDAMVRQLLDAYSKAGLLKDTVVIVTSDHGGIGRNHGGLALVEMERPIVIWGRGVRKGVELSAGTMPEDVGATIAKLLGVGPCAVWRGRALDEAFDAGLIHPQKRKMK